MAPMIKEISSEDEFAAIVPCIWAGYYNPYLPFINLLLPVFEDTEKGYSDAIAESTARLWATHTSDPSSHWIYVTDETRQILSGAHWNFHAVSPYYENFPAIQATWHPEGEGREFASHVINQVYGLRGKRLLRPHAELDMIFTDPKHRNKGYATMLMKWGMDEAEKMEVEIMVEATAIGLPLYKKFGFRVVEKIAVDTFRDNPSHIWTRLESDLQGMTFWWMWKPKNGIYQKGIDVLPWESKV